MHKFNARRLFSTLHLSDSSQIFNSINKNSLPPLERLKGFTASISVMKINPLLNCDTLASINELKKSQYTAEQSEAILKVMACIIKDKFERKEESFISKSTVESDGSLFKSILHELKLDLQGKSNKNSLEIKKLHETAIAQLSRIVESLRDLANQVRTEATMLLNNFKADNREESQKIDSLIHQHNGELTVAMGDFKTEAESVKLKCIYTFTVALLTMFLMIIGERSISKSKKKKAQKDRKIENEEQTELNTH